MKAISLWQPWASLVAIGAKRIETRSWPTDHRGPIAIHAVTKTPPVGMQMAEEEPFWSALRAHQLHHLNLPAGAVVATARLVAVLRIRCDSAGERPYVEPLFATVDLQPWLDARGRIPRAEYPFGDYTARRYAWFLDHVNRVDPPIPARGRQGLWEWDQPRKDAE
jgi:hypothetical protein